LVCFAVPTSQVELVWKAVQAWHRRFHLPPSMSEANQFSLWSKMLGSIQGRPVALKLPIQKATVRWLLAWRLDTLAAHSMASDVASQGGGAGPGRDSASAGSLSGEGRMAWGAEPRDRERSPGRGPEERREGPRQPRPKAREERLI
jgi:hypothetical protein